MTKPKLACFSTKPISFSKILLKNIDLLHVIGLGSWEFWVRHGFKTAMSFIVDLIWYCAWPM